MRKINETALLLGRTDVSDASERGSRPGRLSSLLSWKLLTFSDARRRLDSALRPARDPRDPYPTFPKKEHALRREFHDARV
jgi:hypothetical protein